MFRRRIFIAVAAAVALGGAPAAGAQGIDVSGCDPVDPSFCLYPWPNDEFTKAAASSETGRRLNLKSAAMPRNIAGRPIDPLPYNRNDGFSPGQLILTKVPGMDSAAAFAATGLVPVSDMARYADAGQPAVVINAETGERHPIWAELDSNSDTDANRVLMIRPARNFDEGARYIVALRNMRRADGSIIEPSAAFRAYRDGSAPATDPRKPRMEDIFGRLVAAGIARDDLFLAWDFTVASAENLSERMLHIRDDAFAQLGDSDLDDLEVQGDSPRFVVTGVEDFTRKQNARIARRVEGRVLVPCYLAAPGCPPGSRFAFEPGTNLPLGVPGNHSPANFICNIPHRAMESPVLPGTVGHGLLGSADEVDSRKYATIAETHGFGFCATDWIGMSTEDIPNAVTILADVSRFPSLADRVQQGMLNFLFLGRAMIHEEGLTSDPAFQNAEGEPVFDLSRLYYVGGSQGGIIGAALAAFAPDHTRAALGVPAMNYSTLLDRSVDFDEYAQVMYASYPDRLQRPFLHSLIQILWDRAEANGYAHHITGDPYPNTPDHDVLLHEAFGDHQVANIATEVEARTLGIPVRSPRLDPGRSTHLEPLWGIPSIGGFPHHDSALVIWDVGPLRREGGRTKGTTPPPDANLPNREGVDPHGPDASETAAGQLQIAHFLKTGTVIEVCGSAPCYLDGYTGPQP